MRVLRDVTLVEVSLDYENPWEAAVSTPITEPGWYRITGWEHVDADTAKAEIDAGQGHDLILVQNPGRGEGYLASS